MIGKVQDRIKDIVYPKQNDVKMESSDKADEWFQEIQYLFKLGRYDEALKVCDNALELNVYNSDLLILKGRILNKLQKFENARSFYKKALEIKKHDLGENHPSIANILIDIGELCKSERNYEDAISNYKTALSIQKSSLGSKNPNVAKTLSNLAELYELINNLKESLLLYKYTFDIQEFSLGYNHTEVANTLSNLGRLYAKLENLDASLNSYERALDIQERIYGQQNPEVLSNLNELAKIYIAKNQFNEANASLRRIIAIKKDIPNFGKQTWSNLHRLTDDENDSVRFEAASTIVSIFLYVTDKQQAWNDLHKLTTDRYSNVRSIVASGLAFLFPNVPDKQQAWNDLHRLTIDKDSYVRFEAASTLISIFPDVTDKEQAWNDLHRLTNDENSYVRSVASSGLTSVFSYVPDKPRVLNELIKLTSDQNYNVRTNANHFLGKISLFQASQAKNEEDYKKELEKAIDFFEKASTESKWNNPSRFCLFLYRSFYMAIFREEGKEKVDKCLAEAEAAIGDSKGNKFLFEAVESLANALKEVQNLENQDFRLRKEELNFYRKYCEQAVELMKDAEETAPFAIAMMRKGLPILDRKLKSLLEKIHQKAMIACSESKDIDAEKIACTVSREVQNWEIGSQEEMTQKVEDIAYILKTKVANVPENEFFLKKIEAMRHEKNLTKQYETLIFLITQIPTTKVVQENFAFENISKVSQDLVAKLDGISQEMNEVEISLKPGIKKDFEISSGIEIWGAGSKHIVTIPLKEISYLELVEDLKRIKGKHISKLSKLPDRLARKIKGYLLLNDREDLVKKLS